MLRSVYMNDSSRVDPNSIMGLLSQSHGELTSLYEQEILSLNKEMNEIAASNLTKSHGTYNQLASAYESQLALLSD
mgnify:FL=1